VCKGSFTNTVNTALNWPCDFYGILPSSNSGIKMGAVVEETCHGKFKVLSQFATRV